MAKSGQYTLNLGDNKGEFIVYCDMDQDLLGGGWTVIQRRGPDVESNYFDKDWKLYRNGFGKFHGSFWLGLEKIHRITNSENYELYIGLESSFGRQAWARFRTFQVGDEASGYSMTKAEGYEGTAGDLLGILSGTRFSVFTQPQQVQSDVQCSTVRAGGWWFRDCHASNLNGHYYSDRSQGDGVMWLSRFQIFEPIRRVIMAIRPRPLA